MNEEELKKLFGENYKGSYFQYGNGKHMPSEILYNTLLASLPGYYKMYGLDPTKTIQEGKSISELMNDALENIREYIYNGLLRYENGKFYTTDKLQSDKTGEGNAEKTILFYTGKDEKGDDKNFNVKDIGWQKGEYEGKGKKKTLKFNAMNHALNMLNLYAPQIFKNWESDLNAYQEKKKKEKEEQEAEAAAKIVKFDFTKHSPMVGYINHLNPSYSANSTTKEIMSLINNLIESEEKNDDGSYQYNVRQKDLYDYLGHYYDKIKESKNLDFSGTSYDSASYLNLINELRNALGTTKKDEKGNENFEASDTLNIPKLKMLMNKVGFHNDFVNYFTSKTLLDLNTGTSTPHVPPTQATDTPTPPDSTTQTTETGNANGDGNIVDIPGRDYLKRGGRVVKAQDGTDLDPNPLKRRAGWFKLESAPGEYVDDVLRFYNIPGIGSDAESFNNFFYDSNKYIKDNNLQDGYYTQYATKLLNRMYASNPEVFEKAGKAKLKDDKECIFPDGYYRLKGTTIIYFHPDIKKGEDDKNTADNPSYYIYNTRALDPEKYDDYGKYDIYTHLNHPPRWAKASNVRYSDLSGVAAGGNDNGGEVKWSTTEKIRLGVALADMILAVDPEVWSSGVGGILTALATYGLDLAEGYGIGRSLANFGANAGLTAVGLIPEAGGLPAGAVKAGKTVKNYLPKIYKALRYLSTAAIAGGAATEIPYAITSLDKLASGEKLTVDDYRNIINGVMLATGITNHALGRYSGSTVKGREKITEKAIARNDKQINDQVSRKMLDEQIENGAKAYVIASKEPRYKTAGMTEEYKVLQFNDDETSKKILDAAYGGGEYNSNKQADAVDRILNNIDETKGYHVLRNDQKVKQKDEKANFFAKLFKRDFTKVADPAVGRGSVGLTASKNEIDSQIKNVKTPLSIVRKGNIESIYRNQLERLNVEPVSSTGNSTGSGYKSNYVVVEGKYDEPKSKTKTDSGTAKTEGAAVKAVDLTKKSDKDLIEAARKHREDNIIEIDKSIGDPSKLYPHSSEYEELENRAKKANKNLQDYVKEMNNGTYVPVWKRGASVTRLVQKAEGGTDIYGKEDIESIIEKYSGKNKYEYGEFDTDSDKIAFEGYDGKPNDKGLEKNLGAQKGYFDFLGGTDLQGATNNARGIVFNDETAKKSFENALKYYRNGKNEIKVVDFLDWYNRSIAKLYEYKRKDVARKYTNVYDKETEDFNKLYNIIYSVQNTNEANKNNAYGYSEDLAGINGSTTASRAFDIIENGRTITLKINGEDVTLINNGNGFYSIKKDSGQSAPETANDAPPSNTEAEEKVDDSEAEEKVDDSENKGGGGAKIEDVATDHGNEMTIGSIDVPQVRTRNGARQFDLNLYSPAKLFGSLGNNWLQYKGTLADVYGRDNPIEYTKYYTGNEPAVQQGYQELGDYTSAAMRYRTADSTTNYLKYLTGLSSGLNSVRSGYITDSEAKKTSAADVWSQMKENQQNRYDIAKDNATADMNKQSKDIQAKNTLRASNWTSFNTFLSEMQQNYLTEKSKRDELTESAIKEDIYNTMYADLRKYLGPLYQEGDQEFMDKVNAGIIDSDNWDVDSEEYKRYVRITSALARKYNSEYLKRKGIRISTYEPDVSAGSGSGGPSGNVNGDIFSHRLGGRIAFGRSGGRTVNTTEKIEIQKLRTKVENMKALQKDALKQADMLMKQIDSVSKRIKKTK